MHIDPALLSAISALVGALMGGGASNKSKCGAYGTYFYQVGNGTPSRLHLRNSDRQRNFDLLDSEIDAFNHLIATQCSSQ